jgi:ribosomal protein S27E
MEEFQYLNIECTNCETQYEIRWDITNSSTPFSCPFCGHELEDEAFDNEKDTSDWD